MKRAIKIHEKDNVVVVIEETEAADHVCYEETVGTSVTISALESVPMFHKIASQDIAKGTAVIKYGEHIGVAGEDIKRGQHVHVHNVLSVRENLKERD